MGFRFLRRVTLFPGVRLNFSRSGISASVGPRGASITVGPRGSMMNVGIPGTGLSFRQHLSGTKEYESPSETPASQRNAYPVEPPVAPDMTPIQSASITELTSSDLGSVKNLIRQVLVERESLQRSIPKTRDELAAAKRRLWRSENWFFGIFLKNKISERKAMVEAKTEALHEQEERLSGAFIDADFALDEPTRTAFDRVAQAFEDVAGCAQIWDITSDRIDDRRVTRSAAARSVERVPIRFSTSENPVLQTEGMVLQLENANGANLLIYPGFVYMQNGNVIALIDLREITVTYSPFRFVEREPLPPDAVVVGQTWAKCNKDGSPDRRFANNHHIPIACYGQLNLESKVGLNEEYQFSNAEKAERFAKSLTDYQAKLRLLGERAADEPHPARLGHNSIATPGVQTDHSLKSVAFLQKATAVSRTEALEILKRFGSLFKTEVDSFSGSHSLHEIETLVRELTGVPDVMRSFCERTPTVKPMEAKALQAIKDMVCGYYRQLHASITQIEQKSAEMRRLLGLVCEAEEAMSR